MQDRGNRVQDREGQSGSRVHLWQKQGNEDHALQRLVQIYNWFTEEHNTADLREARALLDKLSN